VSVTDVDNDGYVRLAMVDEPGDLGGVRRGAAANHPTLAGIESPDTAEVGTPLSGEHGHITDCVAGDREHDGTAQE
jgi:hypothetical protein